MKGARSWVLATALKSFLSFVEATDKMAMISSRVTSRVPATALAVAAAPFLIGRVLDMV